MIERWIHRVPYPCRRFLIRVLQVLDPYLCVLIGRLHILYRMIACMTYEGALSEPEDFPRTDEPVWILGKQYSTQTDLATLRSDVKSRIWLTYRRNFSAIGDSGYTSDKGWGCMLRCGQMVLAEAMVRRHLGRDWKWTPQMTDPIYLRIMSMFEDHRRATFSLHVFSQLGVDEGKPVGEWYGPNTVAQVMKKLTPFDEWNNFCVSVAMDNIIIIDEIRNSCTGDGDRGWRPLLLFVPLRLGLAEINPVYVPGLKKCFKMPQSLGLIGGKPNHASYFLGYVGEEIVYLDPHTTQDAGSVSIKKSVVGDKDSGGDDDGDVDCSYHCPASQRMSFLHLDPSLALCFYCGTEKEFDDLCNRLRQDVVDPQSTPLFELAPTRPSYMRDDLNASLGAAAACMDLEDHHFESDDDEEFEVLQ